MDAWFQKLENTAASHRKRYHAARASYLRTKQLLEAKERDAPKYYHSSPTQTALNLKEAQRTLYKLKHKQVEQKHNLTKTLSPQKRKQITQSVRSTGDTIARITADQQRAVAYEDRQQYRVTKLKHEYQSSGSSVQELKAQLAQQRNYLQTALDEYLIVEMKVAKTAWELAIGDWGENDHRTKAAEKRYEVATSMGANEVVKILLEP